MFESLTTIFFNNSLAYRVNLSRSSSQSSWDGEVQTLTLDAEFQSNYRLRIKIYDPNTQRYEVPLEIQSPTGGSANPLYEVQFQNDPHFTIRVIRRSTGTVLFESRPEEEFVFADQFISLSWKPATENVYGVGENQQRTFKHDFEKNITWGLWAKDQPPGVIKYFKYCMLTNMMMILMINK